MFEPIKVIEISDEPIAVDCASMLVVRLEGAAPHRREVYVKVFLNGTLVANGSAADNHVPGVISTNLDTITVPVPNGSKLRIEKTGSGIAEARLFRL